MGVGVPDKSSHFGAPSNNNHLEKQRETEPTSISPEKKLIDF